MILKDLKRKNNIYYTYRYSYISLFIFNVYGFCKNIFSVIFMKYSEINCINLSLSPHIQQSTVDIIVANKIFQEYFGAVVGIGLALVELLCKLCAKSISRSLYFRNMFPEGTCRGNFLCFSFFSLFFLK